MGRAIPSLLLLLLASPLPAQTPGEAARRLEGLGPGQTKALVVVGSSLQKAVESKDSEVGTGFLSAQIIGSQSVFLFTINAVAGDADPIAEDWGGSILTPAVGEGTFDSGLISYRRYSKDLDRHSLGFHSYLSIAQRSWVLPETGDPVRRDTVTAGAVGFAVLASYHVPFIPNEGDTRLSLRFEFGPTWRWVVDEAGEPRGSGQGPLSREALGVSRTKFAGLEAGVSLAFNDIQAGIQYYLFPQPADRSVPGLTGGKFAFLVGIQAEAFTVLGRIGR